MFQIIKKLINTFSSSKAHTFISNWKRILKIKIQVNEMLPVIYTGQWDYVCTKSLQ